MKKKKVLSSFLLTSILTTTLLPFNTFAAGKEFKDTSKLPQVSKDSIKALQNKGAMSGYTDGTFRPKNKITRAEFAGMLINVLNLKSKGKQAEFADSKKGQWHNQVLNIAKQNGLLGGIGVKNGKTVMNPNGEISRLEMMVLLAKADEMIGNKLVLTQADINGYSYYKDFKDVPKWAKQAVAKALESGIVSGVGYHEIGSKAKGTRENSALMGNRVLQRIATYNKIVQDGKKILTENDVDTSKAKLIYKDDYSNDIKGRAFFGLTDEKGKPKTGIVVGLWDSSEISFHQDLTSLSTNVAIYQKGIKVFDGKSMDGEKVFGKEFDKNGKLVYEGSFIYGTRSGQGVLYYQSGTKRYEGDFERGMNTGKGIYYNEDGTVAKSVEASEPIVDYATDSQKDIIIENTFFDYWSAVIGTYAISNGSNYKVSDFNKFLVSSKQLTPSGDEKSGVSTFKNAYGYTYSIKFDESKKVVEIRTKGAKGEIIKDYFIKAKLTDDINAYNICYTLPSSGTKCEF